jgi:GNAT superfamily N-acetyltransferase
MPTSSDTMRLAHDHMTTATEVLARAFFDDPLFTWVEPDDQRRAQLMPWIMGVGVRYGARFGEVYGTAGELSVASVWLPPGDSVATPDRLEQAGFVDPAAAMGEAGLQRFGAFMDHAEQVHHDLMAGDHWYLMILGVDPPLQGRGIGGSILQPMLARVDADGLPCYLETAKARNVPFYRRHGFEVVHDGAMPGGGPRFWGMRREPRRG